MIYIKALGQGAKDIDFMSLKFVYNRFISVIKNLVENDPYFSKCVPQTLLDINEFITRSLHRQ